MADELLKKAEELATKKAQAQQTIALLTDYIRFLDGEIAQNNREIEERERLELARKLKKGGRGHDASTMAEAMKLALEMLNNTVPGEELQVPVVPRAHGLPGVDN